MTKLNPELHNMDKFNYLKSLLSGPAAATIAGLPLTSDNYTAAIELLTKRFGNKQVIISHGQPSKADSGSQKSYITQHARDQLFLPSTGKESLLIKNLRK